MKKIIFTIIAVFVFQFSQAQTIDSLKGTWNLTRVFSTKGSPMDSTKSASMIRFLKKPFITFDVDDEGIIKSMGKSETMIYTYNKKKRKISIVSKSGTTYTIKIDTYNANEIKGTYMGMEVLFTRQLKEE